MIFADSAYRGVERLNSLPFGFQDYAVIGRKGAERAQRS